MFNTWSRATWPLVLHMFNTWSRATWPIVLHMLKHLVQGYKANCATHVQHLVQGYNANCATHVKTLSPGATLQFLLHMWNIWLFINVSCQFHNKPIPDMSAWDLATCRCRWQGLLWLHLEHQTHAGLVKNCFIVVSWNGFWINLVWIDSEMTKCLTHSLWTLFAQVFKGTF